MKFQFKISKRYTSIWSLRAKIWHTVLFFAIGLLTPALFIVTSASAQEQTLLDARSRIAEINAKEIAEGVPVQHRSIMTSTDTKTCKSLLILHGLYESPYYMKGLTSYFESRGFNVVSILLSGHFRKDDPRMMNVTYKNWREDARKGLQIARAVGEKVFVLGYSTGGTMAADLALESPEKIDGMFLFAPALALKPTTENLVEVGALTNFFPAEECNTRELNLLCKVAAYFGAGSLEKARPIIAEGLSLSPFSGVQVQKYINAIYSQYYSQVAHPDDRFENSKYQTLLKIYAQIRAPTFLAVSDQDLTISTPFAKIAYRSFQGPKDMVVYSKQADIGHTNITKYPQDTYKLSPEYYNHFTKELEERMDRFSAAVAPQCQ